MFDYYLWLSHGKVDNFREIQECIETGAVDGNEAHCHEIMRQGATE